MALYGTETIVFAQGTIVSTGSTAYTPGAGTAAVIRRIGIANDGTVDIAFKFYIAGTTTAYRQPAPGTVVAGGCAEWTGAMDLTAGKYLFFTGAGLTYTIDGTELST